ncbi:MAG: carbohydrate ABC transporter permease, partial [Thermosphaera sp.]
MKNYRRDTLIYRLKRFLKMSVLIAIIAVYIMPIYGMFNLAFRSRAEMFANFFLITQPTLENFVEAYQYGAYSAIVNSIVITAGGVGLALGLSILAAYAFSRFNIKGKNLLMFYILSTRMMPPITLIIPIFIMYYTLGLKGT